MFITKVAVALLSQTWLKAAEPPVVAQMDHFPNPVLQTDLRALQPDFLHFFSSGQL